MGVTNGLLLWLCGHSTLNKVAAAGVLLWRGVPFLRVGENRWVSGINGKYGSG